VHDVVVPLGGLLVAVFVLRALHRHGTAQQQQRTMANTERCDDTHIS
jgi:hypothetical protein